MKQAFFVLHSDLQREGPGDRASLDWAFDTAGAPDNALILDAACGPGADIEALLDNAPHGHVTAVDSHLSFVEQVRVIWDEDDRVTTHVADMREETGPFDLIWCAGAMYMIGIEAGLRHFRTALAPGGAIAFSELVFLDTPTPALRAELEAEYAEIGDIDTLKARIAAAGFDLSGLQILSDEAWEAYYTPMEKRIGMLRPGAEARHDTILGKVLDEGMHEIELWRANRQMFGYALAVVRPL